MKTPTKQSIRNKADRVLQEYIRTTHHCELCELCGEREVERKKVYAETNTKLLKELFK